MLDTRNVVDYYKYWGNEAILVDLDTKRHNFGILLVNLKYDLNISGVIRNSNAFLAKEVIIYGKKKIDRRGCVGTYKYTHFRHVKEAESLDEIFSNYEILVGIDNVEGAEPIETFKWPNQSILMIFGQEAEGIPQEILDKCHHKLYIRQYGSVRSLNVASASAIAMFSYCSFMKGNRYD